MSAALRDHFRRLTLDGADPATVNAVAAEFERLASDLEAAMRVIDAAREWRDSGQDERRAANARAVFWAELLTFDTRRK